MPQFGDEPGSGAPARYRLKICRALQCRMNGSDEVILAAERALQICRDETSADGRFHLEIIHCFGHCTEGPNISINEQMHHHTTPATVTQLLRGLP